MSSFNAFGAKKQVIGGSCPVWLGIVKPAAVGGVLASAYAKTGAYYGAGCPIKVENGTITPVVVYEVISVEGSVATCRPNIEGILPTTSDKLYNAKSAFNASAAGTSVTAVSVNATDASLVDITCAISGLAAGDALCFKGASANAYLYNDICIDNLAVLETAENVAATGAYVQYHGEGILIKRTPAAAVATAMAAAVPGVAQVNK